jgi:hypothetical protein
VYTVFYREHPKPAEQPPRDGYPFQEEFIDIFHIFDGILSPRPKPREGPAYIAVRAPRRSQGAIKYLKQPALYGIIF